MQCIFSAEDAEWQWIFSADMEHHTLSHSADTFKIKVWSLLDDMFTSLTRDVKIRPFLPSRKKCAKDGKWIWDDVVSDAYFRGSAIPEVRHSGGQG